MCKNVSNDASKDSPIQEAFKILQLSKDLQNDHNLVNKNFEQNISFVRLSQLHDPKGRFILVKVF